MLHSASEPEPKDDDVASSSEGSRNSSEANLVAEARICGGDREEAQGIFGGVWGKLSLAFDPLRQGSNLKRRIIFQTEALILL